WTSSRSSMVGIHSARPSNSKPIGDRRTRSPALSPATKYREREALIWRRSGCGWPIPGGMRGPRCLRALDSNVGALGTGKIVISPVLLNRFRGAGGSAAVASRLAGAPVPRPGRQILVTVHDIGRTRHAAKRTTSPTTARHEAASILDVVFSAVQPASRHALDAEMPTSRREGPVLLGIRWPPATVHIGCRCR